MTTSNQDDIASVDCIVAGGGPAGMMAGLLLARHGARVTVLERHADFLHDFRGDTIHPSTMRVMDQLGIIDRFLAIPHRRMSTVSVSAPDGETVFADFSLLPEPYNFVAFMPQWDFLDFVAEEARAYSTFELIREARVTDVLTDGERASGVTYETPQGERNLSAHLVIGADGRRSTVRSRAELPLHVSDAPMDVLWFRLSRRPDDSIPFVSTGKGFAAVAVDRGSYWQIAYCIPPGTYDALRSQGVDVMSARLERALPSLAGRFRGEISSWDQLSVLEVAVDRLTRWHRPGLLCIGDAAHAMSPAGGVGINLAVQDAVATARILGPTLARRHTPSEQELARVQRRRAWPARIIQAGQVRVLADLYPTSLEATYKGSRASRVVRDCPLLHKLVARIIGIGLRPESI